MAKNNKVFSFYVIINIPESTYLTSAFTAYVNCRFKILSAIGVVNSTLKCLNVLFVTHPMLIFETFFFL